MTDEGVLDPWVAAWFEENGMPIIEELDPDLLPLARSPQGFPVTREIAQVTDEDVSGVPVRIYQGDTPATGVLVYLHGGGFCIGSIGLMDNVARELTHATGSAVVSVGYRLAPEDPFPAGLDDCETVVRWALANTDRFGVGSGQVAVAGESAGGNLSAAVALRLRDAGEDRLAAQVLLYPGLGGSTPYASQDEFDGIMLTRKSRRGCTGSAYSGDQDIDHDPYAARSRPSCWRACRRPRRARGLRRASGRGPGDYAERLAAEVSRSRRCALRQPDGFLNLGFPAAERAYDHVGRWLRPILDGAE